MNTLDIESLQKSLLEVEDFLIVLVNQGDRITINGWNYVRRLLGDGEIIDLITEAPSTLRDIAAIAKGYAPSLAGDLKELGGDPTFVPNLERLVTRLRQVDPRNKYATLKYRSSPTMRAFAIIAQRFGFRGKNLFESEELNVDSIIIGVRNFRRYVGELERHMERIGETREDVFDPKGIDRDRVIKYLDEAIEEISGSRIGATEYGINLISHLEKTRAEVASKKASWKAVIGGVVIAAAIVSGIADAPGAKKAIEEAYSYIITGTENTPIDTKTGLLLPIALREDINIEIKQKDKKI